MAEISNGDANDLAEEILRREEFLGAREPGFFTRSVNRVLGWIGDLIVSIFDAIFGGAGGGVGVGLAFVLLGLAVLVLIYAVVKVVSLRRRERRDADDEPGARVVFDEVVDPGELRRHLEASRARRDWRSSVIAGFRLAVVELIDRRVAVERPGATTGDFGRDVADRAPELSPTYEPAALSFERAFYSDNEVGPDDDVAVSRLLGQLLGAVSQ